MSKPDYVIFASGGNDSVALVWYAHRNGLQNVNVAYSNTGWASRLWPQRVIDFQCWVRSLGFKFHEIASKGMNALVKERKAFPANGMQFCTTELKIEPAQCYLDEVDPEHVVTCMVGIRREESAARRDWPLRTISENHGGRELWSPLVDLTEAQRDAYIRDAGWKVLPHRSRECSPCVNANRTTFRELSRGDIDKVACLEAETGLTMFRPHRFHGAKGIEEVIRWAKSSRGQYHKDQPGLCDSGMCGEV
jgi:3'-phosphoadenosine 5'-phosphosulfate sulfotransferase (PAPS reductase)/FAD synthetase